MRRALVVPFVLAMAAFIASMVASCNLVTDVDFGAAHLREGDASLGDGAGGNGGSCTPKTCADLAVSGLPACGVHDDGCGNAITCPDCTGGNACIAGTCSCKPKTCPELGATCGVQNDGCGGALDCGGCTKPNEVCVGLACVCKPKSCTDQNANCGTVPDGCGNQYTCGSCNTNPDGPYCGGGGPNKCGQTPCVPKTCSGLGKNCGTISDGCGTLLTCGGACAAPQTCGGGGTANVCGCTPTTCAQQGKNCGTIPNGCGGTLDCGGCGAPQSCGGGGTPNVCGCTPSGACPAGSNCGTVPDGCGGSISCGGACPLHQTCGGGGVANQCGCTPDGTCSRCCGTGIDNCGNSCYDDTCCTGGCFVAGTRIRMADGTEKAIELVRAGEMVASWDFATKTIVAQPVVEAKVHGAETSAGGVMVINGTLHVTPNHPLFVGGETRQAGTLRPNPSAGIMSVERVPGGVSTYDLIVGGSGAYFTEGIMALQKIPQ